MGALNINISRVARCALIALLSIALASGCGGGGAQSPGGEPPGPGDVTYAKSFGGQSWDRAGSFAVDGEGRVTLVGAKGLRPWFIGLDPFGNPRYQMSPVQTPATDEGLYLYGQALADGSLLYAGESSEEFLRNIFLQRLDPAGELLWRLDLDSGPWFEGILYASNPDKADHRLRAVLGDASSGWFVVARSTAAVRLGAQSTTGSIVVHDVKSVVVWFVEPDGEVRWQRRIAVEPTSASEELTRGPLFVTSMLTADHRLAMLLEHFDSSRERVSLVVLNTDNVLSVAERDFDARPDRFDTLDLQSMVETPDGGFVLVSPGRRSDAIGGRIDRHSELVRLSPGGEPSWRRAIYDGSRYDDFVNHKLDVTAVTFPDGPSSPATLWVGGWEALRDNRVGFPDADWNAVLWNVDLAGRVIRRCDFAEHNSVRQLSAVDDGRNLRVLFTTFSVERGTSLIENVIGPDCSEVPGRAIAYASVSDYNGGPWWPYITGLRAVQWAADGAGVILPDERRVLADQFNPEPGLEFDERYDRENYLRALTRLPADGGPRENLLLPPQRPHQIPYFPVDADAAPNGTISIMSRPERAAPTTRIDQLDVDGNPIRRVELPFAGGTPGLFGRHSRPGSVGYDGAGRLWLVEARDSSCTLLSLEPDGGFLAHRNPHFVLVNLVPAADGGFDALGTSHSDCGDSDAGIALIHVEPDGSASYRSLDDDFATVRRLDVADGSLLMFEPYWLLHYGPSSENSWSAELPSDLTDGTRVQFMGASVAHGGGAVVLLEVTGFSLPPGLADPPSTRGDADVGLLKLDAQGRPQWLRVFGFAGSEIPRHLERTPSGYVVLAESDSVDAVTPGSGDLWVLKLGPDGHINADANGVDHCQACLGSITGEQLARLLPIVREPLPELPPAQPLTFTTEAYTDVVELQPERHELSSDNTAQQCLGDVTNIQEPPFGAAASLSVTTTGRGRVISDPFGIDCGARCEVEFTAGSDILLRAIATEEYQFDAWGGACSGTETDTTLTLSGDSQCSATFTPVDVATLDVVVLGQGTVTEPIAGLQCSTPADETQTLCSASYARGETITLIPTAAAGSTWNSWADCDVNNGVAGCVVQLDASRTIVAEFVDGPPGDPTLTVTINGDGRIDSSPAGIACGADCSETYPLNTVVTLVASGTPTSPFQSWSGDCAGGMNTAVTMDRDRQCTATFGTTTQTATLTITVTGNGTVTTLPAGISCPGDCSEDYLIDTAVTVSAVPGAGSTLQGWGGDCADLGTIPEFILEMPFDRSCTVTFDP